MPAQPVPVALLGGTFDPVHYGHLRFADDVRRALGLAHVRLGPAGDPPHRENPSASAADRLAMLRLAVQEFPGLVVDDRELRRAGKSYTVTTLTELRREFPDSPLLLLLGADAFRGLPTWHRWDELLGLAHVVVVARPGVELETTLPPPLLPIWRDRLVRDPGILLSRPAGAILAQPIAPLDVSASSIRESLARGRGADERWHGLLPPAVLAYIDLHRLYRRGSDAP